MKKLICVMIVIACLLASGIPVYAGDIPEGILFSDNAVLFFGQVTSYDVTSKSITVIPTENIKGGVEPGVELVFPNGVLVADKTFKPDEDEIYLMTNYNESNPLYVLRISGTDTETLKLKGLRWNSMWPRLEKYLNDGSYAQKEAERLARLTPPPRVSKHLPRDFQRVPA